MTWASLYSDGFDLDGSDFKGERLTVQFARGPRRKENFPGPMERPSMPRPRRTIFRMMISGLPETSWQVSSPSPFSLGFSGSQSAWPISVLTNAFRFTPFLLSYFLCSMSPVQVS